MFRFEGLGFVNGVLGVLCLVSFVVALLGIVGLIVAAVTANGTLALWGIGGVVGGNFLGFLLYRYLSSFADIYGRR